MNKPTTGERVWGIRMYITGEMEAENISDRSNNALATAWKNGNCFRTKKACKLAIAEIGKTMIRISRES